MFDWNRKSDRNDASAQLAALHKSQAVIEFTLEGIIITANENFLRPMGYSLAEVAGKHHRMFVEPLESNSAGYREFWARLNRGEFQAAEFKRLAKGGREIWIEASYNPVLGRDGKPTKVVKFATDITAKKINAMESAGKVLAIGRSQAVIEFNLDGTIIAANENFLGAMGYSLTEVAGQHHRMFVDAAERNGAAYREFWERLKRGEFQSGEFKRVGKGGREIWILATYNPILDETGKPFKVVKFATDITRQKLKNADLEGQITAIGKSQAVIEFNMDGTIVKANDNFLNTLGYAGGEVLGKHHRMFVEPAECESEAYRQFWAALNRGEYQSGEFKRVGRGGKEVWIQASYNPILDLNGKPYKVVKYATDITQQAQTRMRAERARSLIESVAAGSEEMNASIREISETMTKSLQKASEAVGQVESADHQAQRLTSAAQSMGGITELIGNITGQINLLALNATIESARAGEAGRGFAVVASEVKGLANQAKLATDKISTEIASLGEISRDVVTALSAIKSAIEHVNEFVANTAAAVEEQSSVTSDMSSNMQKAAAELAA
jgi:methyl-accepting chemotaxis protein